MLKKPQPQLDDKLKDTIASEIAELFFEFWQNRRTTKEIKAVAPAASYLEDSRIVEQQP